MSLKLTDTQRRQIQRGNFPHLALEPDEAKALEPHTIRITNQLSLIVTGAKRDKKAGWYAVYTVRDDRPRFMRRGQGYTHSLALAVANEDTEAVPEDYQRELTNDAHRRQDEFNRENRIEDLARQDLQRLNSEIKELAKRAVKMGLDPAVALAPIAKVVEEQHSGLKDAA